MGHGIGGWKLPLAGGSGEELVEVAGPIHINSAVLSLCFSAFLFFCFLFSFFIFCMVHVSDFKNTSGMNSVGSLRIIFDRTAGCIKRGID
jgi:hypothetical protein